MCFISYEISLKVMHEETCSSPDNSRLNKNPFYTMQIEKNDSLFAIKDICQYQFPSNFDVIGNHTKKMLYKNGSKQN